MNVVSCIYPKGRKDDVLLYTVYEEEENDEYKEKDTKDEENNEHEHEHKHKHKHKFELIFHSIAALIIIIIMLTIIYYLFMIWLQFVSFGDSTKVFSFFFYLGGEVSSIFCTERTEGARGTSTSTQHYTKVHYTT